MNANEALLDSWTRQCKALDNLASRVTPDLLAVKPSEDGWSIAAHLCHVHGTRCFWLPKASGREYPELKSLFVQSGDDYTPSRDLQEIRRSLGQSEAAIRDWVEDRLATGDPEAGYYDHPVLFLQHMIWHEGYHFGLIMLALRLAGHEPPEEWEDTHVWDLWRQPG